MATTTQAERILTAVDALPTRALPTLLRAPLGLAPSPRAFAAARGPGAWALARDAAGGLLVLGSWAALWTWFLAATW